MLCATKHNDSLILKFQLVQNCVTHRLFRDALHLLNYLVKIKLISLGEIFL